MFFMMEDALVYEHLVRDAFQCERLGIWFANADCYRGADTEEKQARLREYILISLRVILTYRRAELPESTVKILQEAYDKLENEEIGADDAVSMLSGYLL